MMHVVRQPTFVLVDDDEDDRYIVKLALKSLGYSYPIVELDDGQELIDYLYDNQVDYGVDKYKSLIIMDINMPRLRGTEALIILRQHVRWHKMPILIMSSSTDPYVVKEALLAGANGFIPKSNSLQVITQHIRERLNVWEADGIL